MKKQLSKCILLLAALTLSTACNSQEKSQETSKKDASSDVVVSSSLDSVSSSQEQQSSETQSSSEEKSSSKQEESSDPAPSSSSSAPSTSGEASSSSSSSSSQDEEPFEYDSYLLKHASGSAEYIFEAECTNLGAKEGLGYSGTATESGLAVHDMSGNGYVTYLYQQGLSINYLIVCDRDINNAVLKARLGGEFMHVILKPSNYGFRVDTIITKEDLTEAIGNWDAAFLDYYTDLSETGGYFIDPWDCGSVDIDATGSSDPTGFDTFTIYSKLKLKKGINCISLITMNSDSPGLGTMAAVAPVIDYISITTDANLGMYDINDNGEGTVGVHFKS